MEEFLSSLIFFLDQHIHSLSNELFYLELIIFSVILLILFLVLRSKYIRYVMQLPNVKGGLPFFGQVFTMVKGSPWDTMASWVLTYGRTFTFHLFGSDPICVGDPDMLKTIMTKTDIFQKDKDWTYKPFLVILGTGVVTSEGAEWRRQRTLIAHALKVEILEEIPAITVRAVNRLCKKLDECKINNTSIQMDEEFRHLTLQVIAEAILSLSPQESDETFAKMYLPIVEEGNLRTWNPERMYIPSPAMFKFNKAVKKLNDFVSSIIEKRWQLRMQEKETLDTLGKVPYRRKDILDKTLSAIKPEDWSSESIRQIRDEIKTFILAGHETSASMLTWSLYELSQNQNCLEKVRKEAASIYKFKNSIKNSSRNSSRSNSTEKIIDSNTGRGNGSSSSSSSSSPNRKKSWWPFSKKNKEIDSTSKSNSNTPTKSSTSGITNNNSSNSSSSSSSSSSRMFDNCVKVTSYSDDELSNANLDNFQLPSTSKLGNLEYTLMCLKESLRKYSVVPTVVRVATQSTTLGTHYIPQNSTIMVNIQGVHHNPEFWPEPLVYNPDRFLQTPKPYTFIPFVEGARMCLGQYLSLLESKIVLSLLVSKYKFELVNEDAWEKHDFMIPIIPKNGHHFKIA